MTTIEINDKIAAELSKYSFRAVVSPDRVTIITRKGEIAGWVSPDGSIESRYEGKRNMMGQIARLGIKAALSA